MSLRVYKWIERFNAGWNDTHDEQRTGHLRDSINNTTFACVRALLVEDRWFTISDIHREMAQCDLTLTSHTTIFHILTKELEMRKMSA